MSVDHICVHMMRCCYVYPQSRSATFRGFFELSLARGVIFKAWRGVGECHILNFANQDSNNSVQSRVSFNSFPIALTH